MIVYFSGTGNSKYVAERLGAALNDEVAAVEECTGEIVLEEGEALGIVTPTYWLGLSVMTREFIRKLHLTGNESNYVYMVSTYGLLAGFSGKDAAHELKAKGYQLDACYCVHMPEIWTPIFSANNKAKHDKLNKAAEAKIDGIIQHVQERAKGDFIKSPFPYFLHGATQALVNFERHTRRFHVEDSCISCGLCAKNCPAKAIEIQDGKPVWVKDQCAICLRCLHNCPKFAIQYGGSTKRHGQYKNPNTNVSR